MATTEPPRFVVDFESLECQKENIEPVRQGRSVTSLAKAFDTDPVHASVENDSRREAYEAELREASELDDPLEVWVRYLAWTKEAYPAGQSSHSGYIQLLERCSKQFVRVPHYSNDPRYLKIWIEYARFSDDPREMFCFLARNDIGQDLATFYEEYAAFLEVRDRKGQADEIYQMGLLKGARPVNRLRRKYEEFSKRLTSNPPKADEPCSPPIAPVRSALTTKFGGVAETAGNMSSNNTATRLQIFTDEAEPQDEGTVGTGGWGSIGTLQSRRKENAVEVKKMFGEKLLQKGPAQATHKLDIFKDEPTAQIKPAEPSNRKSERVVCDLEAVYAIPGQEWSFEELKARAMNLHNMDWRPVPEPRVATHVQQEEQYVSVMDTDSPLKDSPKKASSKRTAASPTINTKAAMDDILGIFSQPLKCEQSDESSDSDSSDDEPDNTFAVGTNHGMWTQPGTQSTAGSDYQSDYNEDELMIEPEEPGPILPEIGGIPCVIAAKEETALDEAIEVQGSADNRSIPATPHQQLPPHRANGFDLMTPITEDTENLQISACEKPSLAILDEDDDENESRHVDPYSSPFIEHPPPRPLVTKDASTNGRPALADKMKSRGTLPHKQAAGTPTTHPSKGPAILELVCNPMDSSIRDSIFAVLYPAISTYDGSQISQDISYGKKFDAIEKYIRALHRKGVGEATQHLEVILDFRSRYAIKRKLGEGAFAPVFLIENISGASGLNRKKLEAMKIEKPGSSWEFHIMRQIHRRLGVARASQSIAMAHEYYQFSDCSFLILDFKEQGTLLDLVNMNRSDSGGVDELLAIFLTVELLRTVEALHTRGLLHGDLKSDNCLLRLEDIKESEWSSTYRRDGSDGWQHKGITMIDFGRGIDMRNFDPNVQFIADWKTDEQDCVEMREARPWTYQIDYHGLACIAHSLLFGKYIETVGVGGLGAGKKRYGLKTAFKRYWKQEIWEPLFDLLLNPTSHGQLPVTDPLKRCREQMEDHLEQHGSAGLGLRALIRKVEIDLALAKKR